MSKQRSGVIVTGGSKRVGAELCRYFAKNNFDVALHYNNSKNEAIALQKEIKNMGVACEIFAQDLVDSNGLHKLMENIYAKMPNCNILINNASIFERCEFMETDKDLFDRHFAINFKAPFFLTQAFAKLFGKNPDAKNANYCVINILDTDISKNQISHFAYLLSKRNLADFTKMAAVALGADIRVNGVCPGHMLPSAQLYEGYEEKVRQMVPLKKNPSLDDLSEAVFWLAEQTSITGQIINVDCGKHLV